MSFDFLSHWSFWAEVVATISGILCVYLQTKEKISSWFFGIISVSVLIILFYDINLISDFILNIIFLILNIYGWWTWRKYKDNLQSEDKALILTRRGWIKVSLVIVLVTPLWGYLMLRYFNADYAYLDAFTTVGSLVAQFLLAKKYIENWLIWIIVNVVAIVVYIFKGVYIVAFLYIVYLVLCFKGYIDWKGRDRNDSPHPVKHLLDQQ